MQAQQADQLGGVAGWVVDVIDAVGAVGIALLIALENVFPPIPSEVVLGFAGFSASRGGVGLPAAWVAATAGSLVGAWLLYAVGALVGHERLHELAGRRWFVLFTQSDLARGERFFDRHGSKVVLLARVVPVLRSVVSVPAGLTRMPLVRFSLLTALGSGVWNALFLYLGYRLGERWEQAGRYLQPVGVVVVVLLAVWVLRSVVRTVHRRRARAAD